MTRSIWVLAGALIGGTAVAAVLMMTAPSADDEKGWVTRPVGLSLRVAIRHPVNAPPSSTRVKQLHTLGEQARRDIKECIVGISGAPQEMVLVFEEGVVALASGPVARTTSHGACVAQVLEGLWGEVDGTWQVVLNLALD